MVLNKKAISPVVATALLLVVAVVAVVGFQTWFNTYQSGLNTKVEQQSAAGASLTIEMLENGTVYVKNTATSNVTLLSSGTKVTSDAGVQSCDLDVDSQVGFSSVTQVALNCSAVNLVKGNVYNVVLVSADGVFSASAIAR